MIIALLPGISPIFPVTSILPLIFVLAVAAVKDAIEDYRRFKADKRANGMLVTVARGGEYVQVQSHEVQVGDFVRLERNMETPADLVVLSTALDDGVCYIETANLDGETNIKPRRAPSKPLQESLTSPPALANTLITIMCDAPNESLVKWEGVLEAEGKQSPLGIDNLLFRGCVLRNTPWAVGMVVYAGVDTKMFRNLKKKAPKFSGLDKKLNKLILALLVFQLIVIIILAAASVGFKNSQKDAFYLSTFNDRSNAAHFFLNFLTFFVLLSFMMPISLFVSMELCKAFQAKFMELDVLMATERKSMKAKTSNLNEELSQIRYIFTDKTGTLTENEMRFHRCSVLGYAHCEAEQPGGIRQHLLSGGRFKEAIVDFMKCLALCHSVVLSRPDDADANAPALYEGQSTDEVALVEAARSNGFILTGRTSSEMEVQIMDVPHSFQILAICPFSSDRKRMSIIVKTRGGEIVLYIKGADSTTLPLVAREAVEEAKWYTHIMTELDAMAKEGLRTLVVGMRRIPEPEYLRWKQEWDTASVAMRNRDQQMALVAAQIERDVALLGCTGIEDKLQTLVPETIRFFLDAGVIIWVLTGDKRETAVNIATSSRLVDSQKDFIHHIEASTPSELTTQLKDVTEKTHDERQRGNRVTVVIDGATLEIALTPEFEPRFVQLGLMVSSAVCCRVTPLQKARVVALFQGLGNTALSVGDGANDVSMIQEAKVGVGIMGLEGSQAELASDYAIPKFHHLVRLVAVHGRFALVRNAILIQYSFYKNLVLSMMQVYFAFYNGFSGQTLFDSWVISLFNIIFTSLPPLIMGVFEKDVPDYILERSPTLFGNCHRENFNRKTLIRWGVSSMIDSVVLFFLLAATFPVDDIATHGGSSGIWTQGTLASTALITVVLFKNALATRYWTWIPLASLLGSYTVYFLFIIVYNSFTILMGSANFSAVAWTLLGSGKFYLWILFYAVGLLVPDTACVYAQRRWFPTHRDQSVLKAVSRRTGPTSPRAGSNSNRVAPSA
eukprot:TRINITY_DN1648_c0_g1_i2.p1 TRINITY_DN1648_c0_g1~~TRINITY_DN1648_c0_g1_i2.p1  ORF type:complete len:1123 (+),score=201.78 TRINITY_DN1648_c0_g1_i2:334-3369(+)